MEEEEGVGVCSMMSPATKNFPLSISSEGNSPARKRGSRDLPLTPALGRLSAAQEKTDADALSFGLCWRGRMEFDKWKKNMERSGA